MAAEIGFGALLIALLVCAYGVGAALTGVRKNSLAWAESARAAMLIAFPLVTLAALSLITLLVSGDYQVAYVHNVTSSSMPVYLKITALWGGQSGSLLFWSWLMSLFAGAVTLRKWERDREFQPWVIIVCLATLGFFIGLTLFLPGGNPFERYWQSTGGEVLGQFMFPPAGAVAMRPADGQGLNPLLRHPGMIIHPPMLYLGFVAFVIPFAFAIAALVTGRTDDRWIRITRRWSLVAWLFLSLGLVLGMRWAYDVLGWGGYWGWDPVEVAALNPWLAGTAFLHSVMIQEKRGMFKQWNMILIILTYILVIYGTFLTRSGVLSSVHAFSESEIGPAFFIFIGVSMAVSLGLLLYRWNSLRSETRMTSLLSREALFLYNNLVFMGLLVVCFWGINYPILSELVTNQKITVGAPFYERAAGPLFAALLLLMGIAPLSAWGHSSIKSIGLALWMPLAASLLVLAGVWLAGVRSALALLAFWLVALVVLVTLYEYSRAVIARHKAKGESLPLAFWHLAGRNRRRYGGYIIHLGVTLMALGIIGIEMFQTQTQGLLKPGESLHLAGYTITYDSLAQFDTPDNRNVARAVVSVEKNGRSLGELYPRRDFYYESNQPLTLPGVRSTMEDDLYVLLVNWQPISEDGATFKVYHNPLVNWLWLGALVFIFGTLVAAWPEYDKPTMPAAALDDGGKRA